MQVLAIITTKNMLHDIIHSQIVIQLIGFVGLGLSLLVFQVNKRGAMLRLQMLASVCYAVQFLLLGAFTGSIMNAAVAVRNLTYELSDKRRRSWLLPAAFIAVFIGAEIITWQGPLSLLPFIGTISGTVAFWQRNPRIIRLITLVSPPAWFIYAAITGSYAAVVLEVILLLVNLAAIYRFDIRKPKRLAA